MTDWEEYVAIGTLLVLYAAALVLLVVGYHRSRLRAFLWLGIALFLWPSLNSALVHVERHFIQQALEGDRPWLFPYTLIVSSGHTWSGWEMTPGEFVTKSSWLRNLMGGLWTLVAILSLVRGLAKRNPDVPQGHPERLRPPAP